MPAETFTPVESGTRLERSGRVRFPTSVLRGSGSGAALEVVGDGLTLEFEGELRGAAADEAPDTFTGVGLRVTGRNVTLRGARISGYRVALHAEGADGLVLEDCDVSGNFRQALRSTPEQEADEDWLDPHKNDAREWFTAYGAGIYVERSQAVVVRRCRARRGQNGLVLAGSERAQVYDNDFSFLSGWGIALWRSSGNVIARNACDFCIRGYSHGVYNRGQDSAGILLFEQCSDNVIAENSATHCGDGLFAFAGQEALGGTAPPAGDFDYRGRGNNGNRIFGNDFSYAAAHGLELTFSFDNWIHSNRFVGNAICGIWGGYSRRTRILDNDFEANGDAGYGLERGGVNIEHGLQNRIEGNRFRANRCGIHLWWDEDAQLAALPWVRANSDGSTALVLANTFVGDELAWHLRGPTVVTAPLDRRDHCQAVVKERETSAEARVLEIATAGEHGELPGATLTLPGSTRPVGARRHLSGRDRIQLDVWGPLELDASR